MRSHYCYSLYARDHCFMLKREGEDGGKEFPTVFEAITHIENLPQSDGSTLCIHNQLGHRIAQLLLTRATHCVNPLQRGSQNQFWSQTALQFRN